MARIIAFAFCLGIVVLSSCATMRAPGAGMTSTTSGDVKRACADEDAACMGHSECCSARCDNGVCVRDEP